MILVGIDSNIDKHKKFIFLKNSYEIKNYDANILVIVKFDKKDLNIYNFNTLLGVEISSILDFIFVMNTSATYVVVDKKIATQVQKIATEYLSDTKILVKITDIKEIIWAAENSIDGVIKENI